MATEIQKAAGFDRPHSGAMKFGDDWTGVFIRGDEALAMARNIERFLPEKDRASGSIWYGFISLLRSCDERKTDV